MATRLAETYKNEVFQSMIDKFNYDNPMQVPKLCKITVNMGLGGAKDNSKIMESAIEELSLITNPARRRPARRPRGLVRPRGPGGQIGRAHV